MNTFRLWFDALIQWLHAQGERTLYDFTSRNFLLKETEGKSDLCPNHQDERICIWSFLGVGGDRVKSIYNKRSHSWHTDYIPTSLHQCTHYLWRQGKQVKQSFFSRRKSQSHRYYYSNSYRFSSEENGTTFRVELTAAVTPPTDEIAPSSSREPAWDSWTGKEKTSCSWPEKKAFEQDHGHHH